MQSASPAAWKDLFVNKIAFLAAPAALLLAAPAAGAPVAADPPAQGHALILIPLTLSKLQDLYFGTIIPSALSGTVTIPADGSPATTAGGVTLVSTVPTVRARFAGAGSANQLVFINVTNPGTLSDGAGNNVDVLALTMDGIALKMIDANRAFEFHVGGVLRVNGNQPEGLYSADFVVTAQYL